MAAADKKIITDALNLKITETIPLDKIVAVFVELGFDIEDIKKRRSIAQLTGDLNGLITDLLSSWKTKHGYGLQEAETLKAAMVKHGVDKAITLIQEAIDAVIPPPPKADLLTDENATSTSTSDKPNPMKS